MGAPDRHARRILDSMFLQLNTRLTHEVLCTLMAEVTAIINARPLLPVSADPEQPFILSPSVLLTQKTGVPPPPGDFSDQDLCTKQWRQVQALATSSGPTGAANTYLATQTKVDSTLAETFKWEI